MGISDVSFLTNFSRSLLVYVLFVAVQIFFLGEWYLTLDLPPPRMPVTNDGLGWDSRT